jgi:hypothetical protein
LDAGGDLHRIFGVAEEDCVLGYAGSIESIVHALGGTLSAMAFPSKGKNAYPRSNNHNIIL